MSDKKKHSVKVPRLYKVAASVMTDYLNGKKLIILQKKIHKLITVLSSISRIGKCQKLGAFR